jgi:cytochrome P450
MPQFRPFCIITSPKLVKIIFDGDNSASPKVKPSDKPVHIYQAGLALTGGYTSMFSKLTEGDGWEWARKGCAPSFSQMNLFKRLGMMQNKANEFCEILEKDYVQTGKHLMDFSSWMVSLTIDFIGTSMVSDHIIFRRRISRQTLYFVLILKF